MLCTSQADDISVPHHTSAAIIHWFLRPLDYLPLARTEIFGLVWM